MSDMVKLGDISKNFKITTKELITRLADFGVICKGASSTLTEEQASLVIDAYTQLYIMDTEEIEEMRAKAIEERKTKEAELEKQKEEAAAAEKKKREEEAAKKKAEEKAKTVPTPAAKKPVEAKEEFHAKAEPVKKAPAEAQVQKKAVPIKPSVKPPVKQAVKQDARPNVKSPVKPQEKSANRPNPNAKAPLKPQPKKEQLHKKQYMQAKKTTGTKIDLSTIDNSNTSEEFVVKTQERKRYVDTRMSNVDLDKIASREKIEEDISHTNIKVHEHSGKQKKKVVRNIREKEKKPKRIIQPKVITEVEVPEVITVGDFAKLMGKTAAEVVKKLFGLGVMATVNQEIDFDTAQLVGDEFGINVKQQVIITKEDKLFMDTEDTDMPEELVPRPPVVVVMGHVDHGKTSLLDAIRNTNVISTEAGGITQHIGAYSVKLKNRLITFLDTPGHEAFTTMRARGAQVTDIAILVVAADDGIMPQTVEAINHAKAAGVTIIVAINKIDKENANPEKVKQDLTEYDLVPEEWGGDTIVVEISAKKHQNIDGLLEMVLLVADVKELKANPNRSAHGTVIEARVDKGKGPVASVLVQNGTLHLGDVIIAGTTVGKVRAMVNDKGRRVKVAGPSTPVEIQGLAEAPSGGDILTVVSDEKLAREVAEQRKAEKKETRFNSGVKVTLDNLFSQIDEGNMKELDVIIKADVQGSVEAVKQSLEKLSNDEVRVRAIHGGVGAINESDVNLANASNAIIVGFNVRPDAGAVSAAQQQDVDIRLYRVIYQAIEEIDAAMKGMLEPEFKEQVLGYADVRQVFKVSNVGTIAGCYVTKGKIMRNAEIRVVRNGIIVHEGKIDSLKRFKDDAKEVTENFECGIGIDNFNDVKEGDVLECFVMEEIKR